MSEKVFVSILGNEVVLTLPSTANELIESIRTEIPGVYWDSSARVFKLPLTRRSTVALRKFLTGIEYPISFADAHVPGELKRAADSEVKPDVVLRDNELIINFEFSSVYQNLMQDLEAKGKGNAWVLPLSQARLLRQRIQDLSLDLVLAPNVEAIASTPPPRLGGYDGNLFSLADVSVKVLEYATKEEKGRGKKKKPKNLAERLSDSGFPSVLDVLHLFPLRYIDRSNPKNIKDLEVGETAAVLGTIAVDPSYDAARSITKVVIADASNTRFSVAFFRQPWISSKYHKGEEVIVYGKYEPFRSKTGSLFPQFVNFQLDKVGGQKGDLTVVPVYPQSEKAAITTYDIASSEKEILERISSPLLDPLPQDVISKHNLMSRDSAYRNIHFPPSASLADEARRRLVYEELLMLQVYIQQQKKQMQKLTAVPHNLVGDSRDKFVSSLPYALTGAQARARTAIEKDVMAPHPMHRLLQGDVGAGKSVCASLALLCTVDSGHQGALMAPTEILAEQLYIGLRNDIANADLQSIRTGKQIRVEFLGNKTKAAARREILADLASGNIDIVVGTHAVISESVSFYDLGLAVIDEQHRFGAAQRTRLRQKRTDALTPHLLVMTATPIPRTGAMVVYGDLDLTILDELPPGRTPIATQWADVQASEMVLDKNSPVWDDVLNEVNKGQQAYVIASLIEENENIAAHSAEETLQALQQGVLSSVRVGMVHGKQSRDERESQMSAFAKGEIDVLVATTVIEVGVNVPNATVMVVLNAERFGIAQLHQIRGRVGRSSLASRCYLIGKTNTETGRARLGALVESTDGFYLSEKDLEIRGEGALFGDRQSGDSDLKIARLRDNLDILEVARDDAADLIARGEDMSLMTDEIAHLYGKESIQS